MAIVGIGSLFLFTFVASYHHFLFDTSSGVGANFNNHLATSLSQSNLRHQTHDLSSTPD
jgi:hypothetical protein